MALHAQRELDLTGVVYLENYQAVVLCHHSADKHQCVIPEEDISTKEGISTFGLAGERCDTKEKALQSLIDAVPDCVTKVTLIHPAYKSKVGAK